MSTDIYSLLGAALAAQNPQVARTASTNSAVGFAPAPAPIMLLSEFPVVLTPSDYANARSTANPTGDLRPLWRFRQLVDPLPQFASFYTASGRSTEDTYLQIVQGAAVVGTNPFTEGIISTSQKEIQEQSFANMDGTPGQWRPVYAVPDNWPNSLTTEDLTALTLDLSEVATTSAAAVTEPQNQLAWKIVSADNSSTTKPLDAGTIIHSAEVQYIMVSLNRPWLNTMLFDTSGWYLQGQSAGFCSSGQNDGQGVMSLLPTSIIIGTTAKITADWSSKDAQVIAQAKAAGQQLNLGPLPVTPNQTAPLYVLGWIMDQIPFSPKTGS